MALLLLSARRIDVSFTAGDGLPFAVGHRRLIRLSHALRSQLRCDATRVPGAAANAKTTRTTPTHLLSDTTQSTEPVLEPADQRVEAAGGFRQPIEHSTANGTPIAR
jgi:hypothetical protein